MIIGITGFCSDANDVRRVAGAGKDTVADRLVKHHNFVKVGLADPLKRVCREVYDFSYEQLWGSSNFREEPDKRYPRLPSRFVYPSTPEGAVWVPLYNERGFALIDIEDFDRVTNFRWVLNKKEAGKSTDYVRATIDGMKISLHHYINGSVPEGMVVDHVNGDGLDNRRSNLRVCTQRENRMNQKVRSDSTSGFKGVSWVEDRGKWRAIVDNDTVGYFSREAEAALAYDVEALRRFGAIARLNSQMFLTPRYALQKLGTEWGRDCYNNTWIEYGIRVAKALETGVYDYSQEHGLQMRDGRLKSIGGVVFSDIRFFNEHEALKACGATVVRVRRQLQGTFGTGTDSSHQSERELSSWEDDVFDHVLNNSSDIHHLDLLTDRMLDILKGKVMPYDEAQENIPPALRT